MRNSEELLRLQQALVASQEKLRPLEEDEEGREGSAGGTTDQGTAIEMRMFIETFSLLRNGEKQFGPLNEFDSLAYSAKAEKRNINQGELSNKLDNRLKTHPILGKLSKTDGDTPNMTIDPKQNPDAVNRHENRLQLQMAFKNRQQLTFKPGGM